MPQWTPIAESGVAFTFTSYKTGGSLSMTGSTILANSAVRSSYNSPLFTLATNTDANVRVTFQTYGTTGQFITGQAYAPAKFVSDPLGVPTLIQRNGAAPYPAANWTPATGPQTAWTPSQTVIPMLAGQPIGYFQGATQSDPVVPPEVFSLLVEAYVDTPGKCNEYGRTTRGYVSGYQMARTQVIRVARRQKRCLVADFNGAIPPARTIASVVWMATDPWSTVMSNARIEGGRRSVAVDVDFNYGGRSGINASATLDNGEVYSYNFAVSVVNQPLYPSETYSMTAGPDSLTAT